MSTICNVTAIIFGLLFPFLAGGIFLFLNRERLIFWKNILATIGIVILAFLAIVILLVYIFPVCMIAD